MIFSIITLLNLKMFSSTIEPTDLSESCNSNCPFVNLTKSLMSSIDFLTSLRTTSCISTLTKLFSNGLVIPGISLEIRHHDKR